MSDEYYSTYLRRWLKKDLDAKSRDKLYGRERAQREKTQVKEIRAQEKKALRSSFFSDLGKLIKLFTPRKQRSGVWKGLGKGMGGNLYRSHAKGYKKPPHSF